MTPTDIQSALDALDAIAKDGDIMSYRALQDAANKARAVIEDLLKDRERLEWMAKQEARVVIGLAENGEPDGKCAVAFGSFLRSGWHDEPIEAIDEAMAQRGRI